MWGNVTALTLAVERNGLHFCKSSNEIGRKADNNGHNAKDGGRAYCQCPNRMEMETIKPL
jgi:hypothetical protein